MSDTIEHVRAYISGAIAQSNTLYPRYAAIVSIVLIVLAWHPLYNLYFHPLAKFPGPFMGRATVLWRFWHSMQGRWHRVLEETHRNLGDVIRVGPNELSFSSVSSVKTIYGNRTAENPDSPAPKNEWYDMLNAGFDKTCLVSERDPTKAGEKRALFSAAFTQKALLEQEGILRRCIDLFVAKLQKLGTCADGVDMVKWYEMVSFDIFGEMAFGESFGCLESEKSHHWLDMILDHLFVVQVMDNLRRYPLLVALARSLPSKWTTGLAKKQTQFSRDKVKERLAKDAQQKDFLTEAVAKVKQGDLTEEELVAHASTLVMAGGETTSTSMAAITFYVLRNPPCYEKLKTEIRGRYQHSSDIDITSSLQLPYLQATIKEGLRYYTAGPQGLPRKSKGMVVDGCFVPEDVEVYVSRWALAHDSRYFHEPHVFKPERWLDPACTDVKDASQPFSLGPRVCPGRSFAYAQMSLELTKLLWTFDMEIVDPKLDFERDSQMLFQWRKPRMNVRFRERASSNVST